MEGHPLDESFKRYLFEYRHEGSEWALEVRARDLNDAKARLKVMPWARFRGEIAFSGPIPGGGFLSRIGRLFRSQPQIRRES
jgi:predicted secreted hydrolase